MNNEYEICHVIESDLYGIKTLTMSNDLLSVRILAGKGGEINQITYLPLDMTILLDGSDAFPQYEGRDLSVERLSFYSELATGGWPDVIPGFGKYGDIELRERPIGIAATLPWSYEIIHQGEDSISVKLEVHLPVFPLHMIKIFTLKKGDATFYLEESVHNEGTQQIAATWTQHSAFGGDFVDETVQIKFPADQIFIPSAFSRNGGKEEDFIMPIDQVTMPDGTIYDLRKMRSRMNDGHMVFTQKLDRDTFEMFSESKKIGIRMKWDKDVFPYLRCWYQNTDSGYSIALEPCNYYCHTFDECVENRMFLYLDSGESKTTSVRLEVFKK